ncbi:MAG: toprim domain-containing protein, partial [Xenococcaceae cyanobacterium MO_167.B27]|nr:toprim domain-containing protein [Xenococcaceae cyanobacterium MO_167.B27]
FKNGQGEIDRIVLTESPIDTLSAAAVSQKPETTLFISTDGSGSIPEDYLLQQLNKGKQILVAYDNDQAGEIMAEKVLEKLPGSVRVKPTIGKDWNEQLINSQIQDIAQTVQQVLTKYGEASLSNDSVSFEGNKFIFSSDGNSLNIYSKSRDQVVFEINPAKNHVLYDLNLPEKQILERFKYHPSVVQQQQRGIDISR